MRRAAKVDANHAAIVEALRTAGYSVVSLAKVGDGCPDLLVACDWRRTALLEVKRPGGVLNWRQRRFLNAWQGRYYVVHSPEEALKRMKVTR